MRQYAQNLRGVLTELRIRYHSSGRRPETSHEMSLMDDALALQEPPDLTTELVEALEELVDAMHRYEGDVDGDAPPAHHRMMERARAVLAKVKGKS